ncbi:MAG: hypothetical protein ArsCj_3870 [Arsenophonus endosymbiont of Ceratovacuna japonica]
MLVEQLLLQGYYLGVVSHRYNSKSTYYPLLIDKNTKIKEVGYELVLIYCRTRILVIISHKRSEVVKILIK